MRPTLRLLLPGLLAVIVLTGTAGAGQLQRTDFAGVQPFTFDGFATAVAPFDFGGFTLDNFFDMNAFAISRDLPVVLPTPGGENLVMTFAAPQVAVGMDVATGADVYFYGDNGVLLATIAAADIAAWPARNGFAGYTDDGGNLIYSVQIGTFDAFVDNVYFGQPAVETEPESWGQVKTTYR